METGGAAGEKQSAQDRVGYPESAELQGLRGQHQAGREVALSIDRKKLAQDPDARDRGERTQEKREVARSAQLRALELRKPLPCCVLGGVALVVRVAHGLNKVLEFRLLCVRGHTRRPVTAFTLLCKQLFRLGELGLGTGHWASDAQLLGVVAFGNVDLNRALNDNSHERKRKQQRANLVDCGSGEAYLAETEIRGDDSENQQCGSENGRKFGVRGHAEPPKWRAATGARHGAAQSGIGPKNGGERTEFKGEPEAKYQAASRHRQACESCRTHHQPFMSPSSSPPSRDEAERTLHRKRARSHGGGDVHTASTGSETRGSRSRETTRSTAKRRAKACRCGACVDEGAGGAAMDMDSWATLARLAREAKAELEATEPGAQADINACENLMALAGGKVMNGTWTSNPDGLVAWLDGAKEMAVAVCNGHEPDERMYLPLDAADKPQKILAGWLTQAPEGVRREVQVKYGNDGAETNSAFVTLQERSVRVADTAEAHGGAESEVDTD